MRLAAMGFAAVLALGCGGALEPVVSCDAVGGARPLCGFQNPEDLELVPGTRSLLVSEYGSMDGSKGGLLSRLDLDSEERTVLFRGGEAAGAKPAWGDPECPGPPPPAFSPHGIHLVRRSDGRLALLVVNHGGRESVELFEVLEDPAGARLAWRGCVPTPEDVWMNDLVGLPDGGFLVTHMLPRRGGVLQLLEYLKAGLLGMETGHVVEWRPGRGFAPVPGTATRFANGIALSDDGETIFLNSSMGDGVLKIDRASGETRGNAALPGLDNSTWAPDGRLLVASFPGSLREVMGCQEIEQGACPAEFRIVAVDPDTMETEVLYKGRGAPMGGGTVGLRVDDELFVGSFSGDRVLRVSLSP
jgi:hypothetical protein